MDVKKRATNNQDKALRRASILTAAGQLFLESPSALPSVIKIAQAAGLAKGTVYLYFKTKEEIFLALLEEQYASQLRLMDDCLDQNLAPTAIVDLMVGYLKENPSFLPLASMSKSVLEQNLMLECCTDFKRQLVIQLNQTADKLERQFPALSGKGHTLLTRSYALTLGLWQMLDWPEHLKPLLDEPDFEVFAQPFEKELKSALMMLWSASLVSSL